MSEAMLRLYVTTTAWVQDRYTGRKDRGATAVEYGLLVGLMAAVVIAAIAILGPKINALFDGVKLPASS
ncbi:Flp family type IVb pilin [Microlunatus sp. Gsoil 973]|uniref:Flp family type IVb pilin n=1 Tax=Microlunatus sp. Gsoil 973 TaxID=2672569 RepID=UPI0012B4BD7C|nr:Flp family type IVb pilin [Microlunatus sp. Gsoil 973]QGN33302.1 Flp family type IVb pilin [Microlunatus sp. Gsoil 973]